MSHKPLILFIAPLPPPVHGSAVVSQQIKESNVINEDFDCDWVNLSTSRKVDEIGKNNPVKILRLLHVLFRTIWLLTTRQYDLCYLAITCHGSAFIKDAPFILLCKLFKKKIVIHQHNKGMSSDIDRWPYNRLFPLCYKNATVILLSWYLYPDIENVVLKEDVRICPNGIKVYDEIEHQNQIAAEESVIHKSTLQDNSIPHLLFLSNLIESKGVIVLLDALKILKDKGYSFICDFIGAETKEIDARRFDEEVKIRHLSKIAIYHGKKFGKEKEDAFDRADIFVFPTFYSNETFGIVNLEAMAHKKPIVSTNEGGIPDIVIDGVNGLISERGNPQSLSDCISKLLESEKLRRQMGNNGYKMLKEKYTQEIFEKNMISILKELTC